MITLPPGFDHAELVSAFGTVGGYVVGAFVIILAGSVLFRVLNSGGSQ